MIFLTSSFATAGDKLLPYLSKLPKELVVEFIPTAAEPYKDQPWIETDFKKLSEMGFAIKKINLSDAGLKPTLEKVDIIFVAGGNTTYLLQQAIKTGFINLLHELIANGKIYIGSSAGSVFAGPSIEPFLPEELPDLPKDFHIDTYEAANLVSFVIVPHLHKPKYAEEYEEHILPNFRGRYRIIPLTDEQVVVVNGNSEQLI